MVNAYPLDVLMMVIVAQVAAALLPVNVRLWKNAAVKMRIAKAWGFSVSRKRGLAVAAHLVVITIPTVK
tara:strand:+ start:238 stop:444 length:207 start_codon:yes stop_codon:yes gene_type:complete